MVVREESRRLSPCHTGVTRALPGDQEDRRAPGHDCQLPVLVLAKVSQMERGTCGVLGLRDSGSYRTSALFHNLLVAEAGTESRVSVLAPKATVSSSAEWHL